MYRRSKTIPRVAVELREEHWATEFRDRLPMYTGVWESGLWKHRRIWRIEAAIHFDGPGFRKVEYREHWVYAKSREAAIGCLVRDLKGRFVTHAAIYRVLPPLSEAEVREIEAINRDLISERAERSKRLQPA
ncbi:MAG: hypothetical protein ABFE13_18235 [Phycisphaerales bacterium]